MMSSTSLPVPMRRNLAIKKSNVSTTSGPSATEVKLKMQLDDCERRRKNLVTQSQKAIREKESMEKKYKEILNEKKKLENDNKKLQTDLKELQRVSEGLYKEYETLLKRFNVETDAMHKAMKKATGWYKQNRDLKRQSVMLVEKCLQVAPGSITDLDKCVTEPESDDDQLYDLQKSIKELSSEVAILQVELNTIKLQEFEAQEELLEVNGFLENEKMLRLKAESELEELKSHAEIFEHLASIEAEELASLRKQYENEKVTATKMRKEADEAKKQRNVLAHQSTLLLADLTGEERIQMLLLDIEQLKSKLEDESNKHLLQVQQLQDKIFELESDSKVEILEEKLKLVEQELDCQHKKLLNAERTIEQFKKSKDAAINNEIEDEIKDSVIIPPPPPPLPPPPPAFRDIPNNNPISEMAVMLGIKPTNPSNKAPLQKSATLPSNAIDEIIDQIKAGKFQLRATEKQKHKRNTETPAAVQEMLQILGTMKRKPKTNN